ncbi:MAG: glycosyltransferase [Planctomycetia bacterium]|nr:glycosyltransferase [Planctomycetia bacterium]
MRVLFLHHFPFGHLEAGQWVQRWAGALLAAGHESRWLIVDGSETKSDLVDAVRVICRPGDPAADLPFDLPCFSTPAPTNKLPTFAALSDRQLARYRGRLRQQLDLQIESFNPHVIHAQHIWVQGQLALETGVPYVLNAWGPELIDYAGDERYRALADQAAENAGRILVPHAELLHQVAAMFGSAAERTVVMPPELYLTESASAAAQAQVADHLLKLYQAVLAERFGDQKAVGWRP